MTGYYDRSFDDACHQQWRDAKNEGVFNYIISPQAWMRPVDKCRSGEAGVVCDFHGPLDGARVTQDSFITGRGQSLSRCADSEIRDLPDSVFPPCCPPKGPACGSIELGQQFTKVPRTVNNFSETDITRFAFMPNGMRQGGYAGFNAIVDTHMQSREMAREAGRAQHRTDGSRKRSYGSYDSGGSFKAYQ